MKIKYLLALHLLLLLLCTKQLPAQLFSTTTASTGAEIIEPVGTEKTGELLAAYFYPGRESRTIEVNKNGINMNNPVVPGQAEAPLLHVISSQHSYCITYSFDPFINNRDNSRDSIRIQSIHLTPVRDSKQGTTLPDLFSVGATLQLAPNQAPGQYISGNPYKITIHFN